jgi:methionyl-tRNA synthetase
MSDAQPLIPFSDFAKCEFRVATVTAAEHHPDADRLLKLQLDDGTEGGRQVCAGVRAWYEDPASLVGTQVIIVANLEARKIRGEISEGMVLAATTPGAGDDDPAIDVCVLRPDRPTPPGARVS